MQPLHARPKTHTLRVPGPRNDRLGRPELLAGPPVGQPQRCERVPVRFLHVALLRSAHSPPLSDLSEVIGDRSTATHDAAMASTAGAGVAHVEDWSADPRLLA